MSGEAIYTLPYFLRRDYGNTLVNALDITQTQLGSLSSAFGVLALISYFPGGWVADRFSPRTLLTVSLLGTAGLGFLLATYPPYGVVFALFAGLGVTSILLFWAALIKATRAWGSNDGQGRAFGILDGGRALCGAVLGSIALSVFSRFAVPEQGLQGVILMYSTAIVIAAALAWVFVPDMGVAAHERPGLADLHAVIRVPSVWWQALAVFCAYAGYWGTFNLAGYAAAGFQMAEAEAAEVSVFGTWFGPFSAVAAGWTADRIGASRTMILGLSVLGVAMAILAITPPEADAVWSLWLAAAMSSAAAWGLRGVYYAMLSDAAIPIHQTGAAVGMVSVIGYTPDILVPFTVGWMLDRVDPTLAYRGLFAALAVAAVVGCMASWQLMKTANSRARAA
ncbi:MAG: nitrate/nitrite transporter [Myxococcota bacterium]